MNKFRISLKNGFNGENKNKFLRRTRNNSTHNLKGGFSITTISAMVSRGIRNSKRVGYLQNPFLLRVRYSFRAFFEDELTNTNAVLVIIFTPVYVIQIEIENFFIFVGKFIPYRPHIVISNNPILRTEVGQNFGEFMKFLIRVQ